MRETVVYYYKKGCGDLYHSIRLLQRFHRNLGYIYILTDDDIPFADDQIIKIHMENTGSHKEHILINKLKTFCEMGLCENFIHMSDDFFVNKPFDTSDLLPPMALNDMKDVVKPYPNMPHWNHLLVSTMNILINRGYTTFNHATHSPTYINCCKFLKMVDLLPDHFQYQWQTTYHNIWSNERRFLKDHPRYNKVLLTPKRKVYNDLTIRDLKFFAVTENAWNDELRELIKEKCV